MRHLILLEEKGQRLRSGGEEIESRQRRTKTRKIKIITLEELRSLRGQDALSRRLQTNDTTVAAAAREMAGCLTSGFTDNEFSPTACHRVAIMKSYAQA